MLKFKFLTGDINWQKYGGKFISKKLNNGDFDYWLILDIINMWDATGEENQPQYNVGIQAIAPSQLPEKEKNAAFACCGIDLEEVKPEYQQEVLIEAISEYMGGALIWQESGNNLKKLLKEAHKQAATMGDFLFGFAMDRTQNKIGSTGWDLLRGDILAGLNRITE
jgi:hypothetical protein